MKSHLKITITAKQARNIGYLFVVCMALVMLLASCVSIDDIDDIVKEGTTGVAKIQLANAVEDLSHTREIKAETSQRYGKDLMHLIGEQPIDKQADLISESIQAQVDTSENNTFKGMLIATAIWAVFLLVLRIAVFLFNRYKPIPIKTTKDY
jgi:hypothetical protein